MSIPFDPDWTLEPELAGDDEPEVRARSRWRWRRGGCCRGRRVNRADVELRLLAALEAAGPAGRTVFRLRAETELPAERINLALAAMEAEGRAWCSRLVAGPYVVEMWRAT